MLCIGPRNPQWVRGLEVSLVDGDIHNLDDLERLPLRVHHEVYRVQFPCPAAVHCDEGVGSLIDDRLRVVATLGLVRRLEDGA